MSQNQLAYQRAYRARVGNKVTHKYEKTVNGFLMRVYRNMKSRVTGVQAKKAHLYLGKELLPKDIFYQWAKSSNEFNILFNLWKENKYDRKLCPSIDRIDSSKGYCLENMRWITHLENSRLGNISKYSKKCKND